MPDIHIRLRPEKDEDLARWYEGLAHKSNAVRAALRRHIALEEDEQSPSWLDEPQRMTEGTQAVAGDPLASVIRALEDAVIGAMEDRLDQLPGQVSAAVRALLTDSALADVQADASEDSILAASLDEQLDMFFEDVEE